MTDLPSRLYKKGPSFYYVVDNQWHRIGRDRDAAIAEAERLNDERKTGAPRVRFATEGAAVTSLVLSRSELIAVCAGYQRAATQKARLADLGIPYTLDKRGYPCVLRADVENPPRSERPRAPATAEPALAGRGFRVA